MNTSASCFLSKKDGGGFVLFCALGRCKIKYDVMDAKLLMQLKFLNILQAQSFRYTDVDMRRSVFTVKLARVSFFQYNCVVLWHFFEKVKTKNKVGNLAY